MRRHATRSESRATRQSVRSLHTRGTGRLGQKERGMLPASEFCVKAGPHAASDACGGTNVGGGSHMPSDGRWCICEGNISEFAAGSACLGELDRKCG